MKTYLASRPVRLSASALLVVAAAACGGGGSADAAPSATVEIRDNSYDPATVDVTAGESVTWTNRDDVPHTVTFSDGGPDSSDQLDHGGSFTATFAETGTFEYVCAVHPEMQATVTVTQ